jgi:hypothetical protein
MRDQDAVAKTVLVAPKRSSRWRRTIRISLLLLASYALMWGIGRGQGYLATRAVEDKSERTFKELESSRDRLLRFEARRLLGRAEDALDARNFGIAQQQVRLASQLLAASHPTAEISPLVDALGKYQTVVSEDLGGQHQQLAGWMGQLDAQLAQEHP